MKNLLNIDRDFKAAIGSFIIAFSELEYGLSEMSSMTEDDLRNEHKNLLKHLGLSMDKKINNVSNYIENSLPELTNEWNDIKKLIIAMNRERRFIAHGFTTYFIPHSGVSTFIKEGKGVSKKILTIDSVNKMTDQLYELASGTNGVRGEFHIQFYKHRIDSWNDLVLDKYKIVFKIGKEILSRWKGK